MRYADIDRAIELKKKYEWVSNLIQTVQHDEDKYAIVNIMRSVWSDPGNTVKGGDKVPIERRLLIQSLEQTRHEFHMELMKLGVYDAGHVDTPQEVPNAEPEIREPKLEWPANVAGVPADSDQTVMLVPEDDEKKLLDGIDPRLSDDIPF